MVVAHLTERLGTEELQEFAQTPTGFMLDAANGGHTSGERHSCSTIAQMPEKGFMLEDANASTPQVSIFKLCQMSDSVSSIAGRLNCSLKACWQCSTGEIHRQWLENTLCASPRASVLAKLFRSKSWQVLRADEEPLLQQFIAALLTALTSYELR